MDGIIGDRFAAGRRIRLATQEFATTAFPSVIIQLMQGKLQILSTLPASGRQIVRMWSGTLRREPLTVLKEDFDIIKKIAETTPPLLYPTEPPAAVEARIRARVAVEFAGRGVPK